MSARSFQSGDEGILKLEVVQSQVISARNFQSGDEGILMVEVVPPDAKSSLYVPKPDTQLASLARSSQHATFFWVAHAWGRDVENSSAPL